MVIDNLQIDRKRMNRELIMKQKKRGNKNQLISYTGFSNEVV